MLKFIVAILILAGSCVSLGQEAQVKAPARLNSSQLKFISFAFEVPSLEFELTDKNQNQTSQFEPNDPFNVGLGVGYKGYKASLDLPVPPDSDEVKQKGCVSAGTCITSDMPVFTLIQVRTTIPPPIPNGTQSQP